MIGSLSTSLGFGAMGLCATIGGAISDKYGRKTSITGVSIISSILYFVILRTENIFQYTVIWTFIMSISIIRYQAMMSYSVELSDTKLRFILGMMPNIYYGLGYSCLTLIAYLTQSWVGIFRVSLVLQAINCLTIFLPYSPYWLLSVGRNDEAEKVFEKVHGKIPKENETEKLKDENQSSPIKKISKWEIFKMPETRRLILLNAYILFANNLSYFGLSLNSPNLPGNLYINVFFMALVEILGYIAIMISIRFISRRTCMITTQLFAGIACLVAIPLIYGSKTEETQDDESLMILIGRILSFFGKMCISASYGLLYLIMK